SPPGIDPRAFATACLADSYEVLADLVSVASGIASNDPEARELLWPGALRLDGELTPAEIVEQLAGDFDEVVLVPADVPDLPGLVLAKVFKALQRADVCVAPERGSGGGCVALGLRAPWPSWVTRALDLDEDPRDILQGAAPRRSQVSVGPDWHRMRTPAAIQRLDPGLEGWEMTRSLLAGHVLSAAPSPEPS
ncbi:MAG: DUF2064 domain-containing protein, partial [Propionibacteriaceae bacterium]